MSRMGLLGDLVKDAVVKQVKTDLTLLGLDVAEKTASAVSTGVSKVVDATLGDKETRHNRKEQRYLDKRAENNYLVIKATAVRNELFNICDADDHVKYYVKGKLPKKKANVKLSLLDEDRQPLATVTKSLLAVRVPGIHENDPANYKIEIGGENVATLKTSFSMTTEKYDIVPFGWTVKGNILKWEFTVLNGEDEVAHITRRSGYDTPTFIIDFPDEVHELIALMVVLTLICRER